MVYEKYNGNSASVCIENIDEKDPYTRIEAKAFLSCKNIYEVKLPDTICEIGNWAFAHMKELKRITVPAKNIMMGKDAFLDCDNLREVVVYPDDTGNQGLPYLLGSCITVLKAFELLDFEMAVKQNKKWCELYDKALADYVNQNDEKNFQPVIVGWFNDEGEEEQLSRYIEKVRSNKTELSFLRLKYDLHIEANTKNVLFEYLKKQIEQCDNDKSLWDILTSVLAKDIQYVKMMINKGLLNEKLVLELITNFNQNNVSTEIIAYLVSTLNGENKSIDEQFKL